MYDLQFHIPGDISYVAKVSNQIADYCQHAGFDEEVSFRIHVVVAEAINNIIAYATPECPITVTCMYNKEVQELEIEMIDRGTPLEITPAYEFPECKAESGRGWPIIFSWMDSVSHRRYGSENYLTLKLGLN